MYTVLKTIAVGKVSTNLLQSQCPGRLAVPLHKRASEKSMIFDGRHLETLLDEDRDEGANIELKGKGLLTRSGCLKGLGFPEEENSRDGWALRGVSPCCRYV